MEGTLMKFFSKTMKLNNIDTVPYLTYNSLSEINFINHAFTTRLGGVSTGEFTSMTLLADGLAKVQPVQRRDHEFARHRRDGKAADGCRRQQG